jgi:hypothetical protein
MLGSEWEMVAPRPAMSFPRLTPTAELSLCPTVAPEVRGAVGRRAGTGPGRRPAGYGASYPTCYSFPIIGGASGRDAATFASRLADRPHPELCLGASRPRL